jgi:hypothetical protein
MLKLMGPIVFGMGRKPQKKWRIQIVICLVYIGVGVMQYIVLNLPDLGIGAYHIKRISQQSVDGFVLGIRPVNGIVHYPHPYPGHAKTAEYIQAKEHPDTRYQSAAEQYQGYDEQGHHNDGLSNHP